MGFSAMLADEYILIVPFAYQLQSGLNEQISAAYRNFNSSNSIGLLYRAGRITEYQHSRKPSRCAQLYEKSNAFNGYLLDKPVFECSIKLEVSIQRYLQ